MIITVAQVPRSTHRKMNALKKRTGMQLPYLYKGVVDAGIKLYEEKLKMEKENENDSDTDI